ncbi:MAG: metal-dependent hydrolase [Desulfovibrio sp.]
MPGYKGHLLGGVLVAATSVVVLVALRLYTDDYPLLFSLGGVLLFGALFPDIDTDSKGQGLFYTALVAVDGWLIYRAQYMHAAWLGLLALIPLVGRHRGWIHTWWAMLLLPLPILLLPVALWQIELERSLPFYLAFVLGYFSHLLLDRELF